jgi:hypothetical protein
MTKTFTQSFLLFYILAVVFIFLTHDSYAQDKDLVGYWAFDENDGEITEDASKNENDGTIFNAQWTPGKLASALEFNGSNSYVEIAYNDSFDFTDAKGLTVGGWIQPDGDQPAWAKFMCEERLDNPAYPWSFGYNDKNEIRGTAAGGTTIVTPNVSGWHYVAVIVDVPNNKIMLYQDGKIVNEKVGLSGQLATYGNPLYIGGKKNGHYFRGIIDELVLFRKPLTAEKLQQISERGFTAVMAVKSTAKLTTTWCRIKSD